MVTGYNIRVGDADREAVAGQLREHYADGRLTLDELNERLDQAFAAKTRADLNVVMRDLPASARPVTGPRPGGMPLTSGDSNAWRDAAGGGYGAGSGSGPGFRGRFFAAAAPLLVVFWLLVIIGSLFVFGLGGSSRPVGIVILLAALAFLRRLFRLRRRRGRGRTRRGRRFGGYC
jgi:hypothetical protein